MFRYETINEMWQKFLFKHSELGKDLHNLKLPNINIAAMIFRTNTPCEMRKVHDAGCLCKDCQSFHALWHVMVGACTVISKITERLESSTLSLQQNVEGDIALLSKIEDVLATPSKYDTIVTCLQPRLTTNKLKDAMPAYLEEDGCNKCGFR